MRVSGTAVHEGKPRAESVSEAHISKCTPHSRYMRARKGLNERNERHFPSRRREGRNARPGPKRSRAETFNSFIVFTRRDGTCFLQSGKVTFLPFLPSVRSLPNRCLTVDALTKKAPTESEVGRGGHPAVTGGAGSFTFLHAIVKRVEKSVRLHFGRSKARGGGIGAVTLTHTRTRDIRQKKDLEE